MLCGAPNDCAMASEAAGAEGETCWCVNEEFPKPFVAWLADKKGQTQCLCRECLARARAERRDDSDTPVEGELS